MDNDNTNTMAPDGPADSDALSTYENIFGKSGAPTGNRRYSEPVNESWQGMFQDSRRGTSDAYDGNDMPQVLPGSPRHAAQIARQLAGIEGEDLMRFADDPQDLDDPGQHPEDSMENSEQEISPDLFKGTGLHPDTAFEFSNIARQTGLSADQAKRLAEWSTARETKQAEKARRDTEAAIRHEVGEAGYDGYIRQAQMTAQKINQLTGGKLMPLLQGPAGDSLEVIRLLHALHGRI